MEKLSLKGHKIRVIDYEILWNLKGKKEIFSRRQVYHNVSRFYKGANITVIRPGILKMPILDMLSILYYHRREIERQIIEFNPDVILGFGILNTYLAMRLAKKYHIPFIYYLIDALHKLVPFKILKYFAKGFEIKTLQNADKIITINKNLKEYSFRLGADLKNTIVIGAGIDFNRFNPDIDGNGIREEYGLDENDILLFFMGWLYNFSGLKEVALELINFNKSNIKLMIVGEGDLFDELMRIRVTYGYENKIIMTGQQPYEKIPMLISASDICLLPAFNNDIMKDIVPIKIYEYMACSKPVIATKIPGLVNEFGEYNGVIYADDPKNVLYKAYNLCLEKSALKTQGLKAFNFVKERSWENVIDNFEMQLMKLISCYKK